MRRARKQLDFFAGLVAPRKPVRVPIGTLPPGSIARSSWGDDRVLSQDGHGTTCVPVCDNPTAGRLVLSKSRLVEVVS